MTTEDKTVRRSNLSSRQTWRLERTPDRRGHFDAPDTGPKTGEPPVGMVARYVAISEQVWAGVAEDPDKALELIYSRPHEPLHSFSSDLGCHPRAFERKSHLDRLTLHAQTGKTRNALDP
jgi:hypothetical protein